MGLLKNRKLKTPTESAFTERELEEIKEISVEKISGNPRQPRLNFDEDYINELAESIKEHGILQPILVQEDEERAGEYILIAGENRLRASKVAKFESVKAIVKEKVSHAKLAIHALLENMQRKNLHPIEISLAFADMLSRGEFETQQEIAEKSGLGKGTVSKYISISKLNSNATIAAVEQDIKDIEILNALSKVKESKQLTVLNHIAVNSYDRKLAVDYIKSVVEGKDKERKFFELSKNRFVLKFKGLDKIKREKIDKKIEEIKTILE